MVVLIRTQWIVETLNVQSIIHQNLKKELLSSGFVLSVNGSVRYGVIFTMSRLAEHKFVT